MSTDEKLLAEFVSRNPSGLYIDVGELEPVYVEVLDEEAAWLRAAFATIREEAFKDGCADARTIVDSNSASYKAGRADAHVEQGKLLDDYSDWLHKKGYIDADYYAEEPKAVDAFLASLQAQRKEVNNKDP